MEALNHNSVKIKTKQKHTPEEGLKKQKKHLFNAAVSAHTHRSGVTITLQYLQIGTFTLGIEVDHSNEIAASSPAGRRNKKLSTIPLTFEMLDSTGEKKI